MKKPLLISITFLLSFFSALAQYQTHHIDCTNTHCALNAMAVADVDGNGVPDVISGHDIDIFWHENDGNGSFSFRKEITSSTNYNYTTIVHAADLDGDGDKDVISGSIGVPVGWSENDGDGNFKPVKTILDGNIYTKKISVADLDQDGDLDILVHAGGHLRKYVNNGKGDFDSLEVIHGKLTIFYVADMNADRIPDVLIYNYDHYGDTICSMINVGDGSFVKTLEALPQQGSVIDVVDLNSDGCADILQNEFNGKLRWIENSGNGSFSNDHVILIYNFRRQVFGCYDVNNDGHQDIVISLNNKGKGYGMEHGWLLNNGQGNFSNIKKIGIDLLGQEVLSSIPADVDSDGDLDLIQSIATSHYQDKILWYENFHIKNEVINLYPNPTEEWVNITSFHEIESVSVIDLSGQTVLRINGIRSKTSSLNLSPFAKGVYIIRINTKKGIYSRKVIRE